MAQNPPPTSLIETRGLAKHFELRTPRSRPWEIVRRRRAPQTSGEPIVAVRDLILRIPAGECYGLLGPNGAGKTTTVKMISTLLEPTADSVLVCGYDGVRQGADVPGGSGAMSMGWISRCHLAGPWSATGLQIIAMSIGVELFGGNDVVQDQVATAPEKGAVQTRH